MPSKRLQYDFDFSQVRTREEFQREMGRHFAMDADHAKIWHCISHGLLYIPTACTFRFSAWDEFRHRMPSYARRLLMMIQGFQRQTSEETYTIEFAERDHSSEPGLGVPLPFDTPRGPGH